MRSLARLLVPILGAFALHAALPARADEAALLERIEQLEARIVELEAQAEAREREDADAEEEDEDDDSPFGAAYEARQRELAAASAGADWTRFVRVGGHVAAGWLGGGDDGVFADQGFEIWDARFFIDAELGRDVELGEHLLARDLRLAFEWDLVRIGDVENDLGELFLELSGLLDSSWASLQVGRFQIPVGEAYLRYSRGEKQNPFITHPVGGPWFWDEGLKLFGTDEQGMFGYALSVTDGDTGFGEDDTGDKQVSLKLFVRPASWLQLSVSGLRSGNLGDGSSPASGSLWLGESWARAFGSGTDVPSWIDGVAVPDGPNQLRDTWLGAVDLIAADDDWGRLWLAYGAYEIDSRGMSFYDRTLHYWIAELIVEGATLSESLASTYAGVRAAGLGTYDRDRGYLLDSRYRQTLGYNMRALDAYSAVVGWRITEWLRLRSEATWQDLRLVRGVSPALRDDADDTTLFSILLDGSF